MIEPALQSFPQKRLVAEPNSAEITNVKIHQWWIVALVPWAGFEPATRGIEARCSNPLSYQGRLFCLLAKEQLSIINYQLSIVVKSAAFVVSKW